MVKTKKIKINWLLLIACVIGCVMFGSIGSLFTAPNIPTWYRGLVKPPLNPPNWIFAPVWTLLFCLMGIAFYLILTTKNKHRNQAILIFVVQFIFNILWSLLFFGLQSPLYGLICIYLLWILIYINILIFMRINKNAGMLLIPYLVWVSFASYLNFSIYLLN